MRVRLLHDGHIVREEEYDLKINIYLVQEVLLMLHHAGFRDMTVEAGYTGRPATRDDGMVTFVATK
jgi:hypothetical protein